MGDEEIAGLVVKMALDSGSFNDQLKDINNDMKIVKQQEQVLRHLGTLLTDYKQI